MRDNKNEEPRPQDRSALDRSLTIVLVMDTIGNKGNGTSNSALQYAHELERQGHHVRLVGIGAPEYPARVNKVPWVCVGCRRAQASGTAARRCRNGSWS